MGNKQSKYISAYVAKAYDDSIRERSSSGGIFYNLLQYVISINGVVFGAVYDYDSNNVKHIFIEEEDNRMCGSKYIQSRIEDAYIKAKHFLKAGRIVLFSGTPCQVAGLRSYLNQEYENLYCVDFICHGVPNEEIWKKYLDTIIEGKRIKYLSFRSKVISWAKYSLRIVFQDGTDYSKTYEEDIYLQGFLRNLYLRNSCYQCNYKGSSYLSDITMGDFWGVAEVLPDYYDDFGTSAVITRTPKGEDFLNSIKDRIQIKETSYEYIASSNFCLEESVDPHKKRTYFFKKWNKTDRIDVLIEKCYRTRLWALFLAEMKRFYSKFVQLGKTIINR